MRKLKASKDVTCGYPEGDLDPSSFVRFIEKPNTYIDLKYYINVLRIQVSPNIYGEDLECCPLEAPLVPPTKCGLSNADYDALKVWFCKLYPNKILNRVSQNVK